ncbi:MAG: RsmB/NOP family class I SAM-dependent RNA methyltransferase [Thermoprotei archaeon]|nr:MAG: RsmB/NOP family class I SAM-dependent RNA methyltransferase [Thermoprotei archaeon]
METVIPPEQASFFLRLVLNYIVKTRVSYDKAFRSIIGRYRFPRWIISTLYKLGYNAVNYYYTLRWLSAKHGYGSRPGGIVNFFASIGFSIRRALLVAEEEARKLATSKRLSITYSYPEYLIRDLLRHITSEELEKMLESLNTRKRWLRINTARATFSEALKCLEKTGIVYEVVKQPHYAVMVKEPLWKPIGRNKCVIQGMVVPQDISSILAVESMKPIKGLLLDACSAPGLKLSLAFMISKDIDKCVAIDASARRLNTEYRLLHALGAPLHRITLIRADASSTTFNTVFDLALVDAPCSGLGAVYSDPAVKLNSPSRRKLYYYHNLQYRILMNTLRHARRVVYTTCSIHPLEGEAVVERIVSDGYADPIKISNPLLSSAYPGYSISKQTYRVMPHLVNGQGFYIAVLESKVVG